MKPKFVIKQNKNHRFEVYYVERKGFFLKKEVLVPFITYPGSNNVYPFRTIDIAISELKKEVLKETKRVVF